MPVRHLEGLGPVTPNQPVRVAVVNDYEVIVEGVAAMLRRHPEIVVLDKIVVGEPIVTDCPVDVALYDTYGRTASMADALALIGADDQVRSVALFSVELPPGLVAEAEKAGVRSFIAKSVPAAQLVDALMRISAGEDVLVEAVDSGTEAVETVLDELDWPGKDRGAVRAREPSAGPRRRGPHQRGDRRAPRTSAPKP